MTDLKALALHIEGLDGACRETDAKIYVAVHKGRGEGVDRETYRMPKFAHGYKPGAFEVSAISGISLRTSPKYTASADASLGLIPDGWRVSEIAQIEEIKGAIRREVYSCRLEADGFRFSLGQSEHIHNAITAAALRAIDVENG